jgi:hypothetical protein
MKNEFFSLLRKLNPDERGRLTGFLSNSYYSHNKNLISLFKYLTRFHPDYNISQKDKTDIFTGIYGNIPYNDSSYRSLMHLLKARVEDFLVIEIALKDEKFKKFTLMKYFYDNNIDGIFDKSTHKIEKGLKEKLNDFSSEDLLVSYHLEVLKYNYHKTRTKILHSKNVELKSSMINNSGVYLSLHFFIEMVSDFVIQKTLKSSFEYKSRISLNIDEILDLKKFELIFTGATLNQVYHLYLLLFKTFSDPANEDHYLMYKKAVEDALDKLDTSDAAFHSSCLVSYCIMKKNQGKNDKYETELWNLYQLILEKRLYANSRNRYLDLSLYRAILFLGIRLKLHDQVKGFIENYHSEVDPKEIKNLLNLGYAYFYYDKGQFGLALDHAKYIKLSDFVFKYDVKNLLVKLYYELEHRDSLDSMIHSYHEFLRNDIILNSNTKQQFQNFLEHVEKLLKYSDGGNKLELPYDKDELIKAENVYAKEWLIQKYSQGF